MVELLLEFSPAAHLTDVQLSRLKQIPQLLLGIWACVFDDSSSRAYSLGSHYEFPTSNSYRLLYIGEPGLYILLYP